MFLGGRGEIRTHGAFKGPTVFKTAAFNRSATLPKNCSFYTICHISTIVLQKFSCYDVALNKNDSYL